MNPSSLSAAYRAYIACLNSRDLARLPEFVDDAVTYNGAPMGVAGYRQMLEGNYRDIPDLRFTIDFLVDDGRTIGSRLSFDCTPAGRFLGLDVDGRRVVFHENVFYTYANGKIRAVWSVVDRAAIAQQLAKPRPE